MPAKDVVPVIPGQALEMIEIVHPFLNTDKTGSVDSRAGTLRNSGLDGIVTIWVFGTIFIPAEIPTDLPAYIEFKTIDQTAALKGRATTAPSPTDPNG
jgi:hypothetical protein